MSKILKELSEVTGVQQKKGASDQDYLKALIKATSDLDDKAWNGVSVSAQDWFNEAADALNAKKELPLPPDAAKTEVAPRTRRAAATEEAADKNETPDPKVGDEVVIVTKRDKTVSGKVIEIDKDTIVVDDGKEELELARDRIKNLTVAAPPPADPPEAKTSRRRPADEESEALAVLEPKVGDDVTAVTAKGKEYMGRVTEIEDDLLVIKVGDEELELTPSKLKSLVIHPEATAEKPSRRKAADDESAAEKPADGKKTKIGTSVNKGVSVTHRMRELICENIDASHDDIMKMIKKEGLQYNDATLNVVYAETQKVIGFLRTNKRLK